MYKVYKKGNDRYMVGAIIGSECRDYGIFREHPKKNGFRYQLMEHGFSRYTVAGAAQEKLDKYAKEKEWEYVESNKIPRILKVEG